MAACASRETPPARAVRAVDCGGGGEGHDGDGRAVGRRVHDAIDDEIGNAAAR